MRVDIGARDEAQGLPIPEGLLILAPHFSVGVGKPRRVRPARDD
jgi:hypothetical protein